MTDPFLALLALWALVVPFLAYHWGYTNGALSAIRTASSIILPEDRP